MYENEIKDNSEPLLNNDLVLLALQIGVPVAFINVIADLTATTHLLTISFLKLPFGDWIPILCALWVLLVLHRGPFVVRSARGDRTKGAHRCR